MEKNWIATFTGKKFHPFDPRPQAVCLEDIAHALARMCRFNGHCDEFYSVAQHSAEMAQRAVQDGQPLDVAKWCLFHDAAEAYLPDVCRPIKGGLQWQGIFGFFPLPFENVERRILHVVAEKFGLPMPIPQPVDDYDLRMLATEKRDLLSASPEWEDFHFEPFDERIYPSAPLAAEGFFMNTFYQLFGAE